MAFLPGAAFSSGCIYQNSSSATGAERTAGRDRTAEPGTLTLPEPLWTEAGGGRLAARRSAGARHS